MTRPTGTEIQYVNRMQAMDPDDLARVAEWVCQLEDHPGWQAICTFLEETHGDVLGDLLNQHAGRSGRTVAPEEYARIIGFAAGLNEFQAVYRSFKTADERRRERDRRAAATEQ